MMSEAILFEHIGEIDSTNAELSRRIAAQTLASAPVCLSADIQTSGRGRRGRSWLNTDGAIMMSLACDTSGIASENLPLISIAAALGVHDAISKLLAHTAVKWPNDVVCTDQGYLEKLCGILCELVFAPSGAAFAVIGIGINANCETLPKMLMMPAASLRIKLGKSVDTEALKRQIASAVLDRLSLLRCDPQTLVCEYSRRCATLGNSVAATDLTGKTVCEGTARRILSDGRLVIETENGEIIVDAADVSIRTKLCSE